MHAVGLIPARGGSKGINKKNISPIRNKPLIGYTIEAALNSPSLDRIIVSTDDEEIAEISLTFGAEVPFLRPSLLALDHTPDKPVMTHLIDWLKAKQKYTFDIIAYLRPTTPFKTPEIIETCIKKMIKNNFSSLRTVTLTTAKNHPYWMFQNKDNLLKPFLSEIDISKYYQRQLLPECYRLNGVVDLLRTDIIKSSKNIWGNKIGFVVLPEERSIDIDSRIDILLCEILMDEVKNPGQEDQAFGLLPPEGD